MPSFLSTKRSRVIAAAAGTLTLATAISAAAVAISSGTSAASASVSDAFLAMPSSHQTVAQSAQHGDSMSAAQNLASYDQVRFAQGAKTYAYQVSVAKAAAAKVAAAKVAAERAAAARAAAARAAAAAKAAAAASAAAAQHTQTAAAQQSTATPSGSPQQIAQQMLGQYGWSASQFSCLQPLWYHESGWSVTAENPGSGAYGIPQALPGSQMASAGSDWQTNAATQIKWGLNYIQSRYGSPCGAWAHEQADNWY